MGSYTFRVLAVFAIWAVVLQACPPFALSCYARAAIPDDSDLFNYADRVKSRWEGTKFLAIQAV